MSERLDDLRTLRRDLQLRMKSCRSDQNFAIMGRLLADVVRDIEELERASGEGVSETGLGDFVRRMNERNATAKVSRRASG